MMAAAFFGRSMPAAPPIRFNPRIAVHHRLRVASPDAITDVFHRTEYSDYTGGEPRRIVEVEPKRNASVTRTQLLDGLDRVRTSTVGDQYQSTTTYDVAGNVESVTPSGLGTTRTFSDARGLA